jgi:hypothetical protein
MNNTKWKKFVSAINNIDGFEPQVNIKYVLEKRNSQTFAQVWWEEIEQEGFELIEWIQIMPVKEEQIGRLITKHKTSYANELKDALEKNNINYDLGNGIFTIYGYK